MRGKRIPSRLAKFLPEEKITIAEDGLSSNAPYLRGIFKNSDNLLSFITETNHRYLFDQLTKKVENNACEAFEIPGYDGSGHRYALCKRIRT